MFKSVTIRPDTKLDSIQISSRPEAHAIIFFIVCIIGLCSLPFSEYHNDYLAYAALLFLCGLTIYYMINSFQHIKIQNRSNIKVRKGFTSWNIPFESVTGGYTSYKKHTSRQSLAITHFLSFELEVNLPDNKKHWIRNGRANIFHFGFDQWGAEQNEIWNKFNAILDEKDIPNHTVN